MVGKYDRFLDIKGSRYMYPISGGEGGSWGKNENDQAKLNQPASTTHGKYPDSNDDGEWPWVFDPAENRPRNRYFSEQIRYVPLYVAALV